MKHRVNLTAVVVFATVCLCSGAQASTLWVGNDTSGPVQQWTTSGIFKGTFGASGATGTALDGSNAWTVQPGSSDSVITKYNAAQTPVGTIHFTGGIENGNGFPSWIEDMASGTNHTLWLSGFNGEIYHINSLGTVLSSFNSGHTYSGIEVLGNSVYTTSGISGNSVYQFDLAGNLLSTITVAGVSGVGGLAWDPTTNTFWAGTFGALDHFNTSGVILSTLNIGGGFHDGLAVGDLHAVSAVPLPSTWGMMLLGLVCLGFMAYRQKSKPALMAA
jgi:hypothetical protein